MMRLRGQDGFTLIETVLVMVIGVFVLGATLVVAEGFFQSSAVADRRTDDQDRLRRQVDTMVAAIRDAPPATGTTSPVLKAAANDLVVTTGTNGAVSGYKRWCVTGGTLRYGVLSSATYVDPGSSCTGAASGGWTYSIVSTATNASASLFSYTGCTPGAGYCATPATVGTIGIEVVRVESKDSRTTRLQSAVTPRNVG